jgi:SAM-dependent methyltransferase
LPAIQDGFVAFAPAVADANQHFQEQCFEELVGVEEGSFWFTARNDLIVWALERFAPNAATMLEIGCGTGFVLRHLRDRLPNLRLAGSELFFPGLMFARLRTSDVELFQMDARALPFDSEFDAIGAFDVVEHLKDDQAVFREIHRALRPDGVALFTVPQHRWLWSVADVIARHKRRYTRQEIIAKLRAAGFTIVLVTSFVSLLLPAMIITRRLNTNPCSELSIASPINWVLRTIMAIERTLITMGARFAVGGSLLVVSKRDESPTDRQS